MVILLAALPLVVAVGTLAGLRWPGPRAGGATLALALVLGAFVAPFRVAPARLALDLGAGLGSAIVVLAVLLPGIALFHLEQASGGMATLARALERLSPDRSARVLLLTLGFAPFVESVSGFGVGVIVVIPLALALGLEPFAAATLGLLGQIAVPWGALAIGTALGAQITQQNPQIIGTMTALAIAPLPALFGLLALLVSGGRAALVRWWHAAILGGAVMTAGLWGFSQTVGIELAGVLASLLTVIALTGWARLMGRATGPVAAAPPPPAERAPQLALWRAVAPYGALTALLLATRLIAPLQGWLTSRAVVSVPAIGLRLATLDTPGFWVGVAAVVGLATRPMPTTARRVALGRAWRQFRPSALTIVAFLLAAAVMTGTGMTAALGGAAALGGGFAFLSPALGALGGWLTGSNAGSNAMFANLQHTAATRAGLNPDWIMAGQNGAASYATLASPARTVLAATTASVPGGESRLLRVAGPAMLGAVMIITLIVALAAR